jgi:hypothetical protein
MSQPFDEGEYIEALQATVTPQQAGAIIIERRKARIEPFLQSTGRIDAPACGRHDLTA